jgi:DNA-binding SARP family transcriptional activator
MSANPQADRDRLEVVTDQAIAACGGDARDAVKALIVANEFLEAEVCELMQAVSRAYTRGRKIQDLHRASAMAEVASIAPVLAT